MNFIFTCSETGKIFETPDFTITENRGVVIDADGWRRLEARVTLTAPAPIAGNGTHTWMTR